MLARRRFARTLVLCFACRRCDHTAWVLPRLGPTSSFPKSSGSMEFEFMLKTLFPSAVRDG
jgi:hypothetical protein